MRQTLVLGSGTRMQWAEAGYSRARPGPERRDWSHATPGQLCETASHRRVGAVVQRP
jgi:hypothetical protein